MNSDHHRDEFPRIVAIDTSGSDGSVAAAGGRHGVEIVESLPKAAEHARLVAAAVTRVVGAAGWSLRDVDCIAVVRGPGSFTGLRVGVTTAKAIAWAAPARLVGVSAFECIAGRYRRLLGVPADGRITIPFDAGRGEVFVAEADFGGDGPTIVSPSRLANASEWIASLPRGTCVAGPALESLARAVEEHGAVVAPREAWQPWASAVAEAARGRFLAGAFDEPATLVPEYTRPSYAEESKRPRPEG